MINEETRTEPLTSTYYIRHALGNRNDDNQSVVVLVRLAVFDAERLEAENAKLRQRTVRGVK
jgi:hypothetical protein